jgi:hypothetical protein
VGARAGAVREVARATRRQGTPGEQPVSRRRVAGRVLHTSEDPGRPITVDRPKVEGGRVVAERRHVPVRSRPAGRMPTRSRRSQGRHGFTWRRGERSSSSRRLARGGRNGPPGHEGPEARSEKGSGGAKPRRATAAGGRFGDRVRYGFAGGSRLRSSRSRNVATPGWASRVRAPGKPMRAYAHARWKRCPSSGGEPGHRVARRGRR